MWNYSDRSCKIDELLYGCWIYDKRNNLRKTIFSNRIIEISRLTVILFLEIKRYINVAFIVILKILKYLKQTKNIIIATLNGRL